MRAFAMLIGLTAAVICYADQGMTGSQPTTSPSLVGKWKGAYSYPNDQPHSVSFEITFQKKGEHFEGKCIEPNTFGDKTSKVLTADILNGKFDTTSNFRFTKVYDGTGGVHHSVMYLGTLDKDGKSAKGSWEIVGAGGGNFEMSR